MTHLSTTTPLVRTRLSVFCLLIVYFFVLLFPAFLRSAPTTPTTLAAGVMLKYKVVSGYKENFNDDLQQNISKGWKPVGGVSVTTWNNNLYFAQLVAKPSN